MHISDQLHTIQILGTKRAIYINVRDQQCSLVSFFFFFKTVEFLPFWGLDNESDGEKECHVRLSISYCTDQYTSMGPLEIYRLEY